MNEELRTSLADAVGFLGDQGAAYALIGGLGIVHRGFVRVTGDVDLVLAIDTEAALRLVRELPGSKFRPLFDGVEEVVERSHILPIVHRMTKIKVDLSIGLSGFERDLVARAQRGSVLGTEIPVATAEDLIIMKALAGRPQDDQDLRGLVTARRDDLDWDYTLATAAALGEAVGQDLAGKIRGLRSGS